jgi:hypothetical protein
VTSAVILFLEIYQKLMKQHHKILFALAIQSVSVTLLYIFWKDIWQDPNFAKNLMFAFYLAFMPIIKSSD